jgi:hypothetical protein
LQGGGAEVQQSVAHRGPGVRPWKGRRMILSFGEWKVAAVTTEYDPGPGGGAPLLSCGLCRLMCREVA